MTAGFRINSTSNHRERAPHSSVFEGRGFRCYATDCTAPLVACEFAFGVAALNDHAPNIAATKPYDRVIVIFRNSAIRSESGGCVLKSPENNCPADSGCTIINAEVEGGTFIGIFLL